MKLHLQHILSVIMTAGLVFMSCGHGGDSVVQYKLQVSSSSATLDPKGGKHSFFVTSQQDWLARTDAEWIRLEVSSGKGSATPVSLSFTYTPNTEDERREAEITIKNIGGKTETVSVSQDRFEGVLEEGGIRSADDLLAFAKAVNEGSSLYSFMSEGEVVLLNDIDASSISEWIPIGTRDYPFNTIFNGKGFSIRNLDWSVDLSAYPDAGFFGYADKALITGLTIGDPKSSITLKGRASRIYSGAIVGAMSEGSVIDCTNALNLIYEGGSVGGNVCIAGICGHSSGALVSECENKGNIYSPVVCRAAGFVAYNEGVVSGCFNSGCILAEKSDEVGPAWGCSYNKVPENFKDCKGRGKVDSYLKYKDDLASADSDSYLNAVVSPARKGYDMAEVDIDCTKESYYDWTLVKSVQLADAVKYSHYDCDNIPRKVHVLEIDLSDPSVSLDVEYSNDCVPNPNGNNNGNNGFKIRETLSQLCDRKRSEGENVLAGINSGFFDSHNGISRGFHIRQGQPLYINNPYVVNKLPNHSYALTIYEDGTATTAKKSFSGKLRAGGIEYEWHSLNDTIMRHVSSDYMINLYNSMYKRYPHPNYTNLQNRLAENALYVVAEYESEPMTVNNGYARAKVVSIKDGRTAPLSQLPYITSDKQIGISLSGTDAASFIRMVSVGSLIEFRCDMDVEGETNRPVYTQASSIHQMMKDGDGTYSYIPTLETILSESYPVTFPVVSQDKKKLWLVEVDGRQEWYSIGVSDYEVFRIARKLGGYNVTRFDGGGSSTMWIYDSASGNGRVVNSVSDSRGERSCLSYLLIKVK